uniref:Zinc finger protein DPF3 n=1 Tax=Aceria tosichella TaxID=561515 RepID=A0A6G1SF30_9ACAR
MNKRNKTAAKRPAAPIPDPSSSSSANNSPSKQHDYLSLIRGTNSFNSRLVTDRTRRLPFLDSQTGVAQRNCALWRSESDRVRCQDRMDAANMRQQVSSVLYSYPSQHWLKRRQYQQQQQQQQQRPTVELGDRLKANGWDQNYQNRTGHHELVFPSALSSASSSSSSSSYSSSWSGSIVGELSHVVNGVRLALSSAKGPIRHQHQPPLPPRSESTGSHSFADSDSRDQSSQSVGSPRSQHPDDEHHHHGISVGLASQLSDGDGCIGHRVNGRDGEKEIGKTGIEASGTKTKKRKKLEEFNKSNNASLLGPFKRSASSLLATGTNHNNSSSSNNYNNTNNYNGRKTAQDNNTSKIRTKNHKRTKASSSPSAQRVESATDEGEDDDNDDQGDVEQLEKPLASVPANGASPSHLRPYVCPICDQTYKTRPGLSYHFIHAHDTVLPRNFPVKIGAGAGGKQAASLSRESSDICQTSSAGKKRTGSSTVKLKPHQAANGDEVTTRVLRHFRTSRVDQQEIESSDRPGSPSYGRHEDQDRLSSIQVQQLDIVELQTDNNHNNKTKIGELVGTDQLQVQDAISELVVNGEGRTEAGAKGDPIESETTTGVDSNRLTVSDSQGDTERLANQDDVDNGCNDDDDDDKTVLETSPSQDSRATSIEREESIGSKGETDCAQIEIQKPNVLDAADHSNGTNGLIHANYDEASSVGKCRLEGNYHKQHEVAGNNDKNNNNHPDDKHHRHIHHQHENLLPAPPKSSSKQNLFCDFCLGTADKNRRTRMPEELISCSSCGSSGHPSCLRFSENIRRSVQKYNWQCIECKTCSTCNQADREDQLLFCDDCDRSYHTYCLSPQLDRPPEGNWTCKPCLSEYYTV